jgi:hypothetical protein
MLSVALDLERDDVGQEALDDQAALLLNHLAEVSQDPTRATWIGVELDTPRTALNILRFPGAMVAAREAMSGLCDGHDAPVFDPVAHSRGLLDEGMYGQCDGEKALWLYAPRP